MATVCTANLGVTELRCDLRAGTFDFDLEEQELDESTVRQRVLEEMRFYASARGAAKAASPPQDASEVSARTAETVVSS